MTETRRGNNDGSYLRFLTPSERSAFALLSPKKTHADDSISINDTSGVLSNPPRSIEFLFSHSLPRISPPLCLPRIERREIKRGTTRKGRQAKYYFFFSGATLFLKDAPTNPAINNRVIDKPEPLFGGNDTVGIVIITITVFGAYYGIRISRFRY